MSEQQIFAELHMKLGLKLVIGFDFMAVYFLLITLHFFLWPLVLRLGDRNRIIIIVDVPLTTDR